MYGFLCHPPPPLSHGGGEEGFDFSEKSIKFVTHRRHTHDYDTRYVSLSVTIRHGYVKLPLQQQRQRRFFQMDPKSSTTHVDNYFKVVDISNRF